MLLLKTFIGSLVITSVIFILIMKYIFNENGDQYIWIGLISGVISGLALVVLTKRKMNKKSPER
jgi:LPXTG-motif cell wall-anchored protein